MLDLIASCDQSFRDGLRVREKQALSPSCLGLLKQHVYYDSKSENGLRWATALRSRNGRGHELGDAIGKNFFVGKHAFQSSSIVLILHDIWPKNGQNVVTRKDPSGSWADVDNLEWAVHGDSRRRSAELTRMALVRSVLGHDAPSLGDRLRLNAPCKKGHLWNGHQLGLYHKAGSSWKCDECEKQRRATPENKAVRQEWYRQNLEEQRREGRERMRAKRESMSPEELAASRVHAKEYAQQRHRTIGRKSRAKGMESFVIPPHLVGSGIAAGDLQPFIAAGFDLNQLDPVTVAESRDAWRQMQQAIQVLSLSPSVAQLVVEEQKRYWRDNPEAKKRHDGQRDKREYAWRYKWDPLFRRHECQRNSEKKARNRGNHTVKLCRGDIDAHFAEFDNQCAFCGSVNELIVEHFIPRSKGGPHAIGNLLPACHRCNTSKFNHDPEKWYRSQPFFIETRWRKILRVLGKSKGSVNQLPLL